MSGLYGIRTLNWSVCASNILLLNAFSQLNMMTKRTLCAGSDVPLPDEIDYSPMSVAVGPTAFRLQTKGPLQFAWFAVRK